jgi:hypothetical protein
MVKESFAETSGEKKKMKGEATTQIDAEQGENGNCASVLAIQYSETHCRQLNAKIPNAVVTHG